MTDTLNMDLTEEFDRVPEPIETEQERIGTPADVVVVAPTSQVVDNDIVSEDIFVNPKEGETPVLKADTEFVLINDRIHGAAQIYRLGNDVRKSESISVETVNQFELLRAGIRKPSQEQLDTKLFTHEPTRTGLDMALNEIDNTVLQRCDDLKGSLVELTTNYLKATEHTVDQTKGRFISGITMYNRTLATLLFECEITDFADVKFLFNGGQSLKGLYNLPVFTYHEETQGRFHERLETFKGTAIYESVLAFSESLVTGDAIRYVSDHCIVGSKTAVGARVFAVSEAGLMSTTMDSSIQSMNSVSIANAIAGLGNGASYSWFKAFITTLKTSHNTIRDALATLTSQDDEKPVEERLMDLLGISNTINEALALSRIAMSRIQLIESLFEQGLTIICGTGQLKLGEPLQVAA